MSADDRDDVTWVNEVRLLGRLSGTPEEREMPSGDVVVVFRLVVPRATSRRGRASPGSARRTTVDTIDVACWTARTRRSALRFREGEACEVSGALHRRFFRAGAGAVSRYEVDAAVVARPRAGT